MTDIFMTGVFAQDLIAALVITCTLVLACIAVRAWS